MSTADTPVLDREASALFAELVDAPAVVLAVSGGPDSVALLVLAARWRKRRRRGPRLIAATIDHGLRPEAKREAKAVKELARDLGVEHRTVRWRDPKPNAGLQEQARMARYRLLARVATSAGARHIVTGHTRDDQAETVLFRVARGSGLAGLGAMARRSALPVPGKDATLTLLRPFLHLDKSRLVATLRRHGVNFAQDPSNRDPRFTRVRLRALLPALATEGLDARRFALLARRMTRANEAIERTVDAVQSAFGPWPERGPITLTRHAFSELPGEIALRLLGRAIGFLGCEGPVELGKLEALMAALAGGESTNGSPLLRRTLAGAIVTVSDDYVSIAAAPPRRGAKGGPKA